MLVKASIEPKFYNYFRQTSFKYTQKQAQNIRQQINSQTMKVPYANPFIAHTLPKYSKQQLGPIILHLAKQMDQLTVRSCNFTYLQAFIDSYFKDLVDVLAKKEFHCQVFCLAICRFLQEFIKPNDLILIVQKIKKSHIVDLLLQIYDQIKDIQNPKKNSETKTVNQALFQAILGFASVKYLCQLSEQAINQEGYINKALKISVIFTDLAHKVIEFEAVREFVGYATHLYIFNSITIQPINFYEFCIYKNQVLMIDQKKNVEILSLTMQNDFFSSLSLYAKLDPQYLDSLLKLIKNLLELRIKSQAIIKPFSVLIRIIKQRLFPDLKIKLYKVLVEIQNKKACQLIDRLYDELLDADPDLCYKQTEMLNLKLASKGNSGRKQKFVQLYYKFAMINQKKLQASTINFIFYAYLDSNIQLSQFQVFLGRQAVYIENSALKKLIEIICRQNKKVHLSLLELILGKRLQKSLKNLKQSDLNSPFLQEDLLEAAGSSLQVYQIYLSMIVNTVGSKTIDIVPKLINLSSCIIKIHSEYFPFGLKYYRMISKIATKGKIFSPTVFKYMLICQAIFGDKLETALYEYFSHFFGKITSDQELSQIIFLLEYLVRILKNKSSIIIYFQAILQFQRSQPEFYDKKFYDIQFLVNLIEESAFFRISTYSFEALTILQELSIIIKEQNFQAHAISIFKAWSTIMSRSECINFHYLFCFRQIEKIFPYMKEKEGINKRYRISQLWNLLITLMDSQCQPFQFLKTKQNRIQVIWTADQTVKEIKKGLQIEGDILRNQNMDINWNLFTLTTSFKTYYVLLVNDNRCIIQQRLNSQNKKELIKESSIKQMKKNGQNVNIKLKIQEIWNTKSKAKATLIISGQQFQINYQGYLQSIVFEVDSEAFIKNLSIKDTVTGNTFTQFTQHIDSINQWQIKIASLSKIVLSSLIEKVDFQHIFYLLGEMMKNFKQSSPGQGFKMFVRFSCRLFKHLKKFAPHRSLPYEMQVMNKIFGLVKQGFAYARNIEPIKFTIQLQKPTQYSYYLYHLYVAALLPEELWSQFSKQTQRYLIKLLKQCLKNQQFQLIQNHKIELFELLCGLDYDFQGLTSITNEIILNHQPNRILSFKFEHYISLALFSHDFAQNLTYLLSWLVECILSDNQDFIQKKALCKFLIIQTSMLDIIFTFCSAQSKISLIHYIVHHPINFNNQKNEKSIPEKQQIQKIKELVGTMSKQQRSELLPLLIIEIKQDTLSSKVKRKLSVSVKKSSFLNPNQIHLVQILYINLYLLVKLWDDITDDIIEDVVTVFHLYLKKRVDLQDLTEIIHLQTENTIFTQKYVEFLYKIKTQLPEEHLKYKETLNQIFKMSLELISRSQKEKFLKFMKHYLQFAVQDLSFAFLPLETEDFKQIELYGHSVILQYIYEVLIKIKYNSCFYDQSEIDQFCRFALHYIEFFTVNIEFACQISNPMIYVYPKLVALKQPSVQKLVAKIKQVEKQPYLQLKGGLYFKLILIVLQLLESCNQINFTKIIQLLLLKTDSTKKSMYSSKYNQLNNTKDNFSNKDMTPLEMQLIQIEQEHKSYYAQKQKGILKDIPPQEYDLSSSLMQFFLMRLCEFLQYYADILEDSILKSYSSLVIAYLKHPKIARQINQYNQFSHYQILKYEDIIYLLDAQNDTSFKTPHFNQNFYLGSPKKATFANLASAFRISSTSIAEPPSPLRLRKRSTSPPPITRQKLQLYDSLIKDPLKWSMQPRKMNFTKNFGAKPKQIRFKQFLHIHNVLKRETSKKLFFEVDKSNEIAAFVKKHKEQLKQYKSKGKQSTKVDLHYPLRKIKKIYPYTSPSRTVMRIMQTTLPNMACPIIELVQCRDYSLKKNNKESLNMINYINQDQDNSPEQSLQGSLKDYFNQVELQQEELKQSAEKFKKGKQFCELITREGVYFCQWQLLDVQKVFKLRSLQDRPSSDQYPTMIYGSPDDNLIRKGQIQFLICFNQIQQIFYRKFAQIVNSIEIFMKNGTSKFIVFYERQTLSLFIKILLKVYKGLKVIKDPTKQFAQLNYTQKWIQGSLSNFDYIMMLNKYSGRTHNDINQYYVFPWVLKDYQSDKLDLSDPQVYRDLSKPIGAQNPEKLKRFKQIYKSNMGSHLYGSHYSTSLFVLYYLVRLQPFSTLHRDMQKGSFDLADRLFSSIYQVWDTLMSQSATSDIKELTPQFYYMPAFLKNVGNIEFGQKMCGQEVGDVGLPRWASSPEQFILTMRAALQSDFVSENLHLWIDLIFGKHQCSQEKYNVFISLTYEQKVQEKLKQLGSNPKELEGHLHQIIYFGQCPSKLFNKQHKPKKPNIDLILRWPSIKYKRQSSHTASSQYHNEQALIMKGWKFNQMYTQNNKFILQLQSTGAKKQIEQVSVDYFATFNQLKESLENLTSISRRRSQSRIRCEQNKLYLDKSCLKIGKEIVIALGMNFSFQNIKVNEIWIACYGVNGLRVYNWQQQQFWKWQKQEVSSVTLDVTRMIFSTPSGKVCFYSFFDDRLTQTQAIKQCTYMQTKVISFPRNPSKTLRNQIQCKILCVGDHHKVTLVDHVFQQTLNRTSLNFSGSH